MFSLFLLSAILLVGIRASLIDLKLGILPNSLNFVIGLLSLFWAILFADQFNFLEYFAVVALHLGLVLWPRAGLGAGDLKLITGLGLITASYSKSWSWLFLSYLLAAIWGLFHRQTQTIRFGPWLVTAWFAVGVGELTHVAMAYSG